MAAPSYLYEDPPMVALQLASSDEFSGLIQQMNMLMQSRMGRQFHGFCPTDAWRPAVNLYETADTFLICVDLAGMTREEIDLQVDKGNLVLRGRRSSPMPPGNARALAVHLMEIDHGTFCRTIEIPDNVEEKAIEAAYTDGMLWVTLPKVRAAAQAAR